jgi:hypothetical protein
MAEERHASIRGVDKLESYVWIMQVLLVASDPDRGPLEKQWTIQKKTITLSSTCGDISVNIEGNSI